MCEQNLILLDQMKTKNNGEFLRTIQYDDQDGPYDYEYLQKIEAMSVFEEGAEYAEIDPEIDDVACIDARDGNRTSFFDRTATEELGTKGLVRGVSYEKDEEELTDIPDKKLSCVDNGNNLPMTVEPNLLDMVNWIKNFGEAKIFDYRKPDLSELQVKKGPKPMNIVEDILEMNFVRSLGTDLYVWRMKPACYYMLGGMEAQRFIDAFCKRQYKGTPVEAKVIEDVKKSLLYDSRITSMQKDVLPPYLWAFNDGIVNIKTKIFEDEPYRWFVTETLTASFEAEAKCPVFEKFLASAMCDDARLVEQMWRIIGYILSPDFRAKKFFVFIGPKDSGKSLMAKVIQSLLDSRSCAAMGIGEFGVKFTASELVGKKLAICMDLSNEILSPNSVGMIKAITGGDVIRAEAKYKTAVTVPITAKLLFGSNHPLQLKEMDTAFSDRQIAVPFYNPVPKQHQDRFLYERIMMEIEGITAKAAEAYLRLLNSGYDFLEMEEKSMLPVELDHDAVIRKFIDECCDFSDEKAKTTSVALYKAYEEFAIRFGITTLDIKVFSQIFNKLKPSGLKKKIAIDGGSANGYEGVALKL